MECRKRVQTPLLYALWKSCHWHITTNKALIKVIDELHLLQICLFPIVAIVPMFWLYQGSTERAQRSRRYLLCCSGTSFLWRVFQMCSDIPTRWRQLHLKVLGAFGCPIKPSFLSFPKAYPLDLHTDCFYENRREAIDTRIQFLNEAPVERLCSMLEDVWTSQEGKMCSLINWERFSSLQQAQVHF